MGNISYSNEVEIIQAILTLIKWNIIYKLKEYST